jgi:hypothetical protein
MDDLLTKWTDDQENNIDYIWEIIDYFRKNYKVKEKMLNFFSNNINLPDTLKEKVEELYRITRKNDTGHKDVVKFIIALHDNFPVNVKTAAIEKIIKYEADNPTPEQWLTYFKNKFPKILDKFQNFKSVINVIITRVDEKLNNFNPANGVADKLGNLTDYLGDKLNFEDSNNSSSFQNVTSNLDGFSDTFDFNNLKNQEIEFTDEGVMEDIQKSE